MPNKKGGKGYKKGKGNDETTMQFVDIMPGQYMARVIRILGDRNILCYCDDNVLRICHIRRTMKGRVWIEIGDMVLVSLRDFNADDPKIIKRGDILAKYPPEQVRVLKREGGVNERLFMKLEDRNGITIEAVGEDKTLDMGILDKKQDDGFDFESGSESESEEESDEKEGETKIVSKRDKVKQRGERQERDVAAIESAGVEKEVSLDDL
jgi:translation initiation factor 1A